LNPSAVEKKFIETVRARNLLPAGTTVVAAVSGGGDSVALFRLLAGFAGHMGWKLKVLHVDHGTRPESSEDAEFVGALADSEGLEFVLKRLEPPARGSLEDYFSRKRQEIYRSVARDGDLVATGHTADDRAETLLMRLLEGAGLRGLGGMDYFGRECVRRPLLDFTGKQLRSYLLALDQPWVEDSSNLSGDYLRNRIRQKVMPVLEEISPGCAASLARASANLKSWRDFLDTVVEESLDGLLIGEDRFDRNDYSVMPAALRITALWTIAGKPRGGRTELEKTDRWILSGKNGFHELPGGARLVLDGSMVRIEVPAGRERNLD